MALAELCAPVSAVFITEQLFTCKPGGRKPTHSIKSPTRSRHFDKMG